VLESTKENEHNCRRGDAGKSHAHAQPLRQAQPRAQPEPAHGRGEQRRGRVEQGRQPRAYAQRRKAEEHERQRRIGQAQHGDVLAMAAPVAEAPAQREQRQHQQAGADGAHAGQGEGAELAGTQAHEQVGAAPQGGDCQQLHQLGAFHRHVLARRHCRDAVRLAATLVWNKFQH